MWDRTSKSKFQVDDFRFVIENLESENLQSAFPLTTDD